MKTLLFTALLLCFSIHSFSQDILIRVHSSDTGTYKLSYYASDIEFIEEHLTGEEKKGQDGREVEFRIPTNHPIALRLYYEGRNLFPNLCAETGDTIDVTKVRNNYRLEGKWRQERKYQYSIPGHSLFHFLTHPKMYSYPPEKKVKYWEKIRQKQLRNLKRQTRKLKLSPEFVREKRSEIQLEYLFNYFQLPFNEDDYSAYFPDSLVHALINSVDWDYPYNQRCMNALYTLPTIVNGLHYERAKESCPDLTNCSLYNHVYQYEDSIIRNYFPSSVQPLLHYAHMQNILEGLELSQGNANFDSIYQVRASAIQEHLMDLKNTDWMNRIEVQLADLRQTEKALLSAFDSTGARVDLSTFEGKVVYIDFWSRGCFPCIQEFPFSKTLQKTFQDEEVVFLFIAFEKDWSSMNEFLNKKGIEGKRWILPDGFTDTSAIRYHIRSIPRYMLVDKKGNFISKKAPRPSFEFTADQIREALKEED